MGIVVVILYEALRIYSYVMLAMIIFSWLLAYNVINRNNQFVDAVWRTLVIITEPVLKPIRRILPRTPIDLSPLVVFFGIWVLQYLLIEIARRLAWT